MNTLLRKRLSIGLSPQVGRCNKLSTKATPIDPRPAASPCTWLALSSALPAAAWCGLRFRPTRPRP